MTAQLINFDESSLLIIVGIAGCTGVALLGVTERWFRLPHTLHRWVIGWAIAVGAAVFLYALCVSPPSGERDLIPRIASGVIAGILAGVALLYVVPLALCCYFLFLLPIARFMSWCSSYRSPTASALQGSLQPTRTQMEAQTRREDARAACEILYGLHAPELAQRFPRETLDDFIARYMGDDRTPDEVEKRSAQLQGIIRQHADRVRSTPKVTSLESLQRWYEAQVAELNALPIDKELKDTQLRFLHSRHDQLMRAYIDEAQP